MAVALKESAFMNAIFFSIWIDGRTMGPPAVQKALDQIDAVHENVRCNSKEMVFCRTAGDIRKAHAQGKIAALIGVEGGHMIGNDIRVVRIFGDLGVRYMTLSHFYNDEWADSSTDKPVHNGLTDYGKDIVREMNRQGIMPILPVVTAVKYCKFFGVQDIKVENVPLDSLPQLFGDMERTPETAFVGASVAGRISVAKRQATSVISNNAE